MKKQSLVVCLVSCILLLFQQVAFGDSNNHSDTAIVEQMIANGEYAGYHVVSADVRDEHSLAVAVLTNWEKYVLCIFEKADSYWSIILTSDKSVLPSTDTIVSFSKDCQDIFIENSKWVPSISMNFCRVNREKNDQWMLTFYSTKVETPIGYQIWKMVPQSANEWYGIQNDSPYLITSNVSRDLSSLDVMDFPQSYDDAVQRYGALTASNDIVTDPGILWWEDKETTYADLQSALGNSGMNDYVILSFDTFAPNYGEFSECAFAAIEKNGKIALCILEENDNSWYVESVNDLALYDGDNKPSLEVDKQRWILKITYLDRLPFEVYEYAIFGDNGNASFQLYEYITYENNGEQTPFQIRYNQELGVWETIQLHQYCRFIGEVENLERIDISIFPKSEEDARNKWSLVSCEEIPRGNR